MIDVCLLLEGTYPFVAGGVSTWVHQLITSMKDIRFGIVYIAAHSDPTRTVKYPIPDNVLYMKEIFLHDYRLNHTAPRSPRQNDYDLVRSFYEDVAVGRYDRFPELVRLFKGPERCLDMRTVFSAKEVWDILVDFYDDHAEGISFLDYFWTWRGTHLPLLQVLQEDIPQAKIYHAVSTGYAGFLGVVAKLCHGSKFLLTEHGIYTHERMLEISQANWIYEQERSHFRAERELSFFKKWWSGIFYIVSRLAYRHADRIFTLFEGNKMREILEGAAPEKITIIPNGIKIVEYLHAPRQKKETPQIGMIGRVVMIKDVKTYLQAAKIVLRQIPDACFYVVGPTAEEEDYFQECKILVEALGLQDHVTFTGWGDVKEYCGFLDLVVLTSLSEAQPYAILEANIMGVPAVATDVGACREMLEGGSPEDRALGPSGLVTEVANPEATAAAIVRLLQERDLYRQCAEAGKERVKRYYDLDDLLGRYLNIYEQNL